MKRILTTVYCSLFLVGLVMGDSADAAELTYRYSNPIELPEITQPEMVAISLDAQHFAVTKPGLEDIRIRNSSGKTVSFVLRRATEAITKSERVYWQGIEPQLRLLGENGLELTLQLKKNSRLPRGLCLVTPLKNFENRVQVFTSEDGEDWEQIGKETLIFDYSKYMDVKSHCVEFPETKHKHFRVVVEDITSEQETKLVELTRQMRGGSDTAQSERVTIERRPFRIERIDFWTEVTKSSSTRDKKTEYPVNKMAVGQDEETQQTDLLVDVDHVPITMFELQVKDRIFNRKVQVQIEQQTGIKQRWKTISKQNISRIDFQNIKRENLKISIPESRHGRYRILIDNHDSPPLNIQNISATGNVYQAIFFAEPESQFEVAYGYERAMVPQYDTAAISEFLSDGMKPKQAHLGTQSEITIEATPPPFEWSRVFKNGPLMIGLIALLVLILGVGLYSASKRMPDGE